MKSFALKIRRFMVSEDGPTAVEYAVMLALIVIVCFSAITTLGTNAKTTFTNIGTFDRRELTRIVRPVRRGCRLEDQLALPWLRARTEFAARRGESAEHLSPKCSDDEVLASFLNTFGGICRRSTRPARFAAVGETGMKNLALKLRRFMVSEDGPTAVEYAVMLALIVIVCLSAITTFGTNAKTTFTNIGSSLGS